jgi:ribosomal protein S18 acetylase RimI-like enzyme
MTAGLVIRPWSESDVEAVRSIALTTWRATYGQFIPDDDIVAYHSEHYAREVLVDFLRSPGNYGFVAEVDGVPVGFARTHISPEEKRFYLTSIYVLPHHQGHGAGRALQRAAEEEAKRLGANAIWLGVMEQNEPALAWYRALGFVFLEEAPFTMGSTTVNHLIGYRKI